MATRAVARRQSATGETTDAARSVRAGGGEIADRDLVGMYLDEIARTPLLDAAKEVELSQVIEAGVFAQGIFFPMVAEEKSRVRTIVMATHTDADLDEALGAFEKVGKSLGVI